MRVEKTRSGERGMGTWALQSSDVCSPARSHSEDPRPASQDCQPVDSMLKGRKRNGIAKHGHKS